MLKCSCGWVGEHYQTNQEREFVGKGLISFFGKKNRLIFRCPNCNATLETKAIESIPSERD